MSAKRVEKFRQILEYMDQRVLGDLRSLEDQARAGLGGDAGGNMSNAPMHMADLGTEQYLQELNATLFENEEYIRLEVRDALGRVAQGAYGLCERCGVDVPEERLEVLPYTRYCTACSAAVADGAAVDLNVGRPDGGLGDFERRHAGGAEPDAITEGAGDDLDHPFTDAQEGSRTRTREADRDDDIHAAGTAGGGTAIGGLAGTNIGEGDPTEEGELEEAMGSGNFDQELDDDHDDTSTYSGPTGGAVGGSVADLRSTGGKTGGGINPRPGPGESPVGQ